MVQLGFLSRFRLGSCPVKGVNSGLRATQQADVKLMSLFVEFVVALIEVFALRHSGKNQTACIQPPSRKGLHAHQVSLKAETQ